METMVAVCKALGDETRYKILTLLLEHDYCVGSLAAQLNISESAVSQQLKILKNCDLVWGKKQGYFTHYTVHKEMLKNVAEEVTRLSHIDKEKSPCSLKGLHTNTNCTCKKTSEE